MTAATPQPGVESRPGLYRRFYNWILHWAYTPYAQPALAVMAFAESSFFPIPPDVLLLPMCLGNRMRAFRFAFLCSIASVVGGAFGYWLGMTFWDGGLREFCFQYVPGFTPESYDRVKRLYEEYAFVAVFAAGFTPIPYKLFTIAGGVFKIDFAMFLLASAISRSARFYLEAVLLRAFGQPVREFIDRRLGLVTVVFCVCLFGGFYLVKHVL